MNDPLVVILQTYKRTDYALQTLAAMAENFRYDNALWYVADDGSEPAHMDAIRRAMASMECRVIGEHSERIGYGASANRAWHKAHEYADMTLWLEDDWMLRREFNPTAYMQTLANHADLGMIRLGHLPINLRAETCGYDGAMYLRIHQSSAYTFSGNPALRHRRAREMWGAYPEGLYPGDTEVAYDAQVREHYGVSIVWPVNVGAWGLYGHIGAVQSYEMPKVNA